MTGELLSHLIQLFCRRHLPGVLHSAAAAGKAAGLLRNRLCLRRDRVVCLLALTTG